LFVAFRQQARPPAGDGRFNRKQTVEDDLS